MTLDSLIAREIFVLTNPRLDGCSPMAWVIVRIVCTPWLGNTPGNRD